MKKIFLGLGSNLGNRHIYLEKAINTLRLIPGIRILKRSSIFETEPVGYNLQNDFLNIVIEISCALDPVVLLETIKSVELSLGRFKTVRWGPRIIDIDILFFDDRTIDLPILRIPHPEMYNRRFVLEPLLEIAPDFCCPVSGLTIRELNIRCCDLSRMRIFTEQKNIYMDHIN